MISLAALEEYTEYAKNAHSNGLSIEDIEKAMADQGVDEYSRTLVANQLKSGIGSKSAANIEATSTAAAKALVQKNKESRERTMAIIIYIVAITEPLGVIPQLYTIFSRHDASNVAGLTWVMFVVFDLAWLWYGWESQQKPLIVSSVLYTALELLVVIGAVLYGGHW